MSKYIKQDDIFELVRTGVLVSNGNFESVCKAVGSLPTIDIVHCKDCEHYVSDGGAIMLCEHTEIPTEEEYFCVYGERREQ